MLAFILQVVLFQLLFLLVYEVLLKKETFFTYNRWYLLATSVISLLLPLIKIEALGFLVPAESLSRITIEWLPEVLIGETAVSATSESATTASTGLMFNWWVVIYGVGVVASLFVFLRKYQELSRLFRFRAIAAGRDLRIIEVPNSTIACTFYKTIFLGEKLPEAERHQILSHELIHVKQKHSLDLLFFELYKIIFWFNPLIYLYQSRIATLHEFIADAAVVNTSDRRAYYEQLLNSAFNTTNISFINQFFNHSLIKKRIVMLQKSKSKTISKFKFLVLLPLMLVMLTYVACSDDNATGKAEELQAEKELLIEVESFVNQTEEEKAMITAAIEEMTATAEITKVRITDGVKTFTMTIDPETGTPDIAVENLGDSNKVKAPAHKEGDPVPFAVIDEVPVFPGCENLGSNEELKECMSTKISEFVSREFNTGMGKELGLTGVNRVITIFQINENGEVVNVRARAPHPDLEKEAIRVINELPQMSPGKQGGKEVGVSYSLPIVFQIGE